MRRGREKKGGGGGNPSVQGEEKDWFEQMLENVEMSRNKHVVWIMCWNLECCGAMKMGCLLLRCGEHSHLTALATATKFTWSPLFHRLPDQGLSSVVPHADSSEVTQNFLRRKLWLSIHLTNFLGICCSSRCFLPVLLPFLFTQFSDLHWMWRLSATSAPRLLPPLTHMSNLYLSPASWKSCLPDNP